MVFMEDSDRSATLAREAGVDTGLHLNLTTPFSDRRCPAELLERQGELAAYLRRPLAAAIFNPKLVRSFEYVVSAQIQEFQRLYGAEPVRFDGHHHMHLCSNVLFGRLLPPGTIARRNFHFRPGEKSLPNRLFRRFLDRQLAKRHRVVDFFFSLPPMHPADRLHRIFSLAREFVIEMETHPVNPDEYAFLEQGEIFRVLGDVEIAPRFALPWAAAVT
jgi:hypothetical protein